MSTRTLHDYTDEELAQLPYPALCALRRDAITVHVASMPRVPRLDSWAAMMSKRCGSGARVHHLGNPALTLDGVQHDLSHLALGWLEALLVVRYGEAPYHWPAGWSDDDVTRAEKWLFQGDTPNGVTYLTR